jgi:hypothetical protein
MLFHDFVVVVVFVVFVVFVVVVVVVVVFVVVVVVSSRCSSHGEHRQCGFAASSATSRTPAMRSRLPSNYVSQRSPRTKKAPIIIIFGMRLPLSRV